MQLFSMTIHFDISKLGFCSLFAAIVVNAFMLVSCGEDRTYEYELKTEHNIWVYDEMTKYYLWADKLGEQNWKDRFGSPIEYFSKLTSSAKDNWSYIENDSTDVDNHQRGNFNHLDSYGYDFELMNDITGETTKTFARVISVFENSPADRAGLERNDFIESFNGYKISQKNKDKLAKGDTIKLSVKRLAVNADSTVYYWSDSREVILEPSQYVEDKAIPLFRTIRAYNKKVGYAQINRLTDSAIENPKVKSDYKADLDQMMQSFKNENIDELILDFRLCNFGSLEMACRLSSYIIPDNKLDQVFAKTTWNESNSANNKTIKFDSSLSGKTLGMKRVYVITGAYTQGAAEWVIMALKYALGDENVILVGGKTAGQHFLTQCVADYKDYLHIYPVVAEITNGLDEAFNAFEADIQLDEFEHFDLYGYGAQNEILLNACLVSIFNLQ